MIQQIKNYKLLDTIFIIEVFIYFDMISQRDMIFFFMRNALLMGKSYVSN